MDVDVGGTPAVGAVEESPGIDSAFEQTERRGEVLAAGSRILIAITMLLAAWTVHSVGPASHPMTMVSVLYALISVAGLVLVLGRVFHPSLPYAFVLLDSAAIAAALTMQARMHGMDVSHEFSLPLFSLAFVVLIHAALRYRPALVLFGAGAFISFLFLLPPLLRAYLDERHAALGISTPTLAQQEDVTLHDIGFLPLLFLVLAVFLLYYIVRRTRGLARLALLDGQRVAQLTRFFSPEVANRLVAEHDEGISRGRRQMVSILFIDIRGFTRLSENMTPEELTELLASFRSEVCQIIFDHGGTIDKFIGDAVLAAFGTPDTKADDAERATKAAFAVCRGIRAWHDRRKKRGEPCALVGVGAHSGEVYAGVIASGDILEHSVIGDAVNVAQRLERLTRRLDADVVLSDQLLKASGLEATELDLVRKDGAMIRGHSSPVTIYHNGMSKGSQGAPAAGTYPASR